MAQRSTRRRSTEECLRRAADRSAPLFVVEREKVRHAELARPECIRELDQHRGVAGGSDRRMLIHRIGRKFVDDRVAIDPDGRADRVGKGCLGTSDWAHPISSVGYHLIS